MIRHKLGAVLGATTAVLASAGIANAATLTASVAPSAAGSTQTPAAHTTTLSLSKIYPGIDGNAQAALETLVDSLPSDFMTTFSHYSSCSASVVVHGDNKPKCPDSSVLGSAGGTAYVPSFHFDTTTDQGYIFKIDNNTMKIWVHVSKPLPAGLVAQGKISQGSSPFGPVVTWDFSTWASGAQAGVEVRVNHIDFSWTRQTAASSTRPARPRCKPASKKHGRKHQRCTKPKPKPTSKAVPYSPFASTGCSTGKWQFQAAMTFADNTKQTASTSVGCKPTQGSSSQSPSPGPGGGGVLCPPVCAPSADLTWPGGFSTSRTD